jgi:putrescine transport system permease protein
VTVWTGFSTKWYGELLRNQQLLDAAWLSIRIAATNATFAVVLGTLAANALVRHGRFRGRGGFELLLTAPLVMPDVIIGLSLLLLFVAMQQTIGWPDGRGFTTITIAHLTFSMAYVAVVVRARLAQMDRSLEEAAMDLGARPLTVYLRITLPLIGPALLSGWLLAFTLSLDDLVIASFVSGPGSTTLPMVIYSSVRMGVSPQINALATLIVLFVTVAVIVVSLALRGGSGDRTR